MHLETGCSEIAVKANHSLKQTVTGKPAPVGVGVPRFAAELTRSVSLLHLGEREIFWVEAFPVRYDKDAVSDLSSDQSVRHRLPYGQKASQFEREREYRFVVAMSGVCHGAPEFLDLQLGHPERFGNHCASGSAV